MSKNRNIRPSLINIWSGCIGAIAIALLLLSGQISQGMSLDQSQKYEWGLVIIGIGVAVVSAIIYMTRRANKFQKILLLVEGIIVLWAMITVISYFALRGMGGTL